MLQLRLFDATPTPSPARTGSSEEPARPNAGIPEPASAGLVREGLDVVRPDGTPSVPVEAPAPASDVEFVRHPRARRYLLRVRTDGTVRVTIPRRGSKRDAVSFYEQHLAWVAAQRRRVAELRKQLPAELPLEEQRRLRRRAMKELPARLQELAAQVGLSVRKVSVRDQKHRWGSCSTSGLICLNWRLVTMPDWVRHT